MFVIEDEIHCDWHGQFASFDDAVAELRRRATLPWDQPPNAAPCTSWKTCGRKYVIIEFDDSNPPWKQTRRLMLWHGLPTMPSPRPQVSSSCGPMCGPIPTRFRFVPQSVKKGDLRSAEWHGRETMPQRAATRETISHREQTVQRRDRCPPTPSYNLGVTTQSE
jgi:hypothetical protein